MKKSTGMMAWLGCTLLTAAAQAKDQPAVTVTVHADRAAPEINPYTYGQFIEHLGRCIYGGIWAEMLEDRKFYFPVTAKYDPYRSLRDTAFPVVGASPWEIVGAADAVTMVGEGSFVGRHTPRIAPGAAIRQHDLGVVKGKGYTGYIWLKAPEGAARAEVALAWGDGDDQRQAVRIDGLGPEFTRHELAFTAGADTEKAKLEIRIEGGPALIGTASLMPADNVRGMRADTLTLLKQLGGTMYRWPGGNFVSGYEWRDGIGPRDRRPPRRNPAWTGVEHNDFGLDEFLDFCREIGAEPVVAVNTGFGDADSAAREVEYCNGPAETIGGGMRAANGRAEPYGVKYWCVGNEMFGPWQLGFMQLKHYTIKHNGFAEAMRAVDPSLQLIGVGDLDTINRRHDPDERRGWSRGMLEECAKFMNLISEHFYRDDKAKGDTPAHARQLADAIRGKAEGHRKLQKELGLTGRRPVPIAMDEWNYWHRPYVYGELGCVYDLADALGVATGLHEFFRNSDVISMAHYAQTVNVIGCIKTTKTAAFFESTALPLMMHRHHYGTIPVELTTAAEPGGLDLTAALTADRKALTVGLVNPTDKARTVRLSVEGVTPAEEGTAWAVSGDSPSLRNDPGEARLEIVERPLRFDGSLEAPPLSITVVRLPLR
ncbi:alpha-L-arabinofuranosidase C-terminal domain-containing protein [Paludisphaera soli]|uniref:alpha-L-arabinofuranosidase C-terminal domain-containing protein n=1 Tax=Paludisphaera soli TaxID=2712865 RepID=UPI001981F64F|nr:alpha-L-arabinofuranosidase C-terminal domain-containing protein [Paludisphaera soli]